MKQKIRGILLIMTLIMSISSLVIANPEHAYDVGITAGTTIEEPLSYDDIEPSSVLGGLVANVVFTYERFVDFAGTRIWRDLDVSATENFTLYLFPAGSDTNFEEITTGELCAVSEDVLINGVQGIWQTFCNEMITDGGDLTGIGVLNDVLPANNGNTFEATTLNFNIDMSYNWNNGTDSGSGTVGQTAIDDADAVSYGYADVADFMSVLDEILNETAEWPRKTTIPELGNMLVLSTNEPSEPHFFIDVNGDGMIDFSELVEGFQTQAIQTETLSIIPESVYDIYAIV